VATATSRSAVSRQFVTQTETALAGLLSADLSTLDLVALMIDGVDFAESCCVVELGIDLQGTKTSAGAGGGLDQNATLTTDLGRSRGLWAAAHQKHLRSPGGAAPPPVLRSATWGIRGGTAYRSPSAGSRSRRRYGGRRHPMLKRIAEFLTLKWLWDRR